MLFGRRTAISAFWAAERRMASGSMTFDIPSWMSSEMIHRDQRVNRPLGIEQRGVLRPQRPIEEGAIVLANHAEISDLPRSLRWIGPLEQVPIDEGGVGERPGLGHHPHRSTGHRRQGSVLVLLV